jgi:hypothetical protein
MTIIDLITKGAKYTMFNLRGTLCPYFCMMYAAP